MTDIRSMQIGQVVDFVIDYNKRVERSQKENKQPTKRKATKADIQKFFGG